MFGKRFWTFNGLYILLALACLPLLLEWVPPNRWVGFQLPGAYLEPELWYEVNRVGGKLLISAMAICAALNLLLFWVGPERAKGIAGWINAGLIVLGFWLVTVELVGRFSG